MSQKYPASFALRPVNRRQVLRTALGAGAALPSQARSRSSPLLPSSGSKART